MSYGKILGRLVVTRRGKPRDPNSKSGQCVPCHEQIKQGELHMVLLKTVKTKKKKIFWTTRRFHLNCLTDWLAHQLENFPEVEKKAKAKRYGNRPRPVLANCSAEDLVERTVMMKRRSYLFNRLFRNPQYDEVTRTDIEVEIKDLASKIDAIEPSRRFGTKKRKARYEQYVEQGGTPIE